jgi:predicted deacylase
LAADTVQFGNVTAPPGQRGTGVLSAGELDQLSFARGQIDLPLIVVNGATQGPKLFVMAGTHAGEYSGMEATIAVTRRINPSEFSGTLVAIPVLNIFGFAAKVPYVNPLDNLNINRLWPGSSGGTVGQRIAYTVWNAVITKVDYVIDMHGGDFTEDQADYAICVETGHAEADRISEEMARHYCLPFIRKAPPSESAAPTGSASRMTMKLLRKPSITPEVGDGGRLDARRLEQNIFGLENIMRYLKMLPGAPVPPPADQRVMVDRKAVLASVHGLCRIHVKIGDAVAAGQVVAEVVDFYGEVRETLRTPIDGVVVQVFYQGATNPGNIVAKIGQIAP